MLSFLQLPKPTPLPPALQPPAPPAEYAALCAKLGIDAPNSLERRVRAFLNQAEIPIYSTEKVNRYMTRLARREWTVWRWRPLRIRDAQRMQGWRNLRVAWWQGGYDESDRKCRVYTRLVPFSMLQRVERIEEHFAGQGLAFFVSDYHIEQDDKVDPFIMCTAPDATFHMFVFGMWDEPGFSG